MQKKSEISECHSGGGGNDDSKSRKEDEKEGNLDDRSR